MKLKLALLFTIAFGYCCIAQQMGMQKDESWKKMYRSFPTKENNLVHTKLQAKFDYENSQLKGKVWLTLKPHFYATNKLRLDAKGMDINEVAIVKNGKNIALGYSYEDGENLNITLDKTYTNAETYTIYIDYVAKPNDYKTQGSAAITDAKGLYFINPKGEEKDKATQIWTQGETEATSVWVPTIDRTNQKSTQEFYLTVPNKYVSLSNGKLITQTKNADGTRTDYWKMDLPHAPYLFFIGVGDYAIVKDTYKGKEVSYYVEKEYEKVARKIFGNTPEMMKYFSEKVTGVEYPWVKYAQITGQDYVSGAMENTTSTLHGSFSQQNARELQDGNNWEGTVAHELFHQWFGDYVTAESWSNLTVNESFADYSQYLWEEYKYGADAAGEENYNSMQAYLRGNSDKKDLVRFYYADKEDMFDLVSYQKGGRILHMLRNIVGDDAFFKSLNKYLTDNKFGNGSGHKLRLAFEAVTGKDLNWFFNQWYFGNGHPKFNINYSYANGNAMVVVEQTQAGDKIFKMPVKIDVYSTTGKTTKEVWVENKVDTFLIASPEQPLLINFDADKIALAEKKENKTMGDYFVQYKRAGNYVDRREAIDFAMKNLTNPLAIELLELAVNDNFHSLRIKALQGLQDATPISAKAIAKAEELVKKDTKKTVIAEAIDALATTKNPKYKEMYEKLVFDSSYSVAGAALTALTILDEAKVTSLLPTLKKDMKGRLKTAVEKAEILGKTDADFDEMYNNYNKQGLMEKFTSYPNFVFYVSRLQKTENFKKGVDVLVAFRDQVAPFGQGLKERLNKMLLEIKKTKESAKEKQGASASLDEQLNYITEKTKD